ncbi:MAG: hypothetical protein ACRCU1_11535 [Alsobacter sp.]
MTSRLSPDVIMRAVASSTLEWKLTDPLAFGLTTATPLQRAICRAADGVPLGELAHEKSVQKAFGNVADICESRPDEIAIISGIRTAKSLTAACGAFHMALTCDVSMLGPGEIPRVSVISLKKDLSDVIMNHLVGRIEASRILKPFLVDRIEDGIVLRHPSGRLVEVRVVAGKRAGASLVARWSAGIVFDEFPRMVGGDDAVVNWDDQRKAVIHRLLEGAQMWHIGSPDAPYGPAYEMVNEAWGKPTKHLVVVRAPAFEMNPAWWTPERCEERKTVNPAAYKTDVLAEFASPEEAMFSLESVMRCTRKGDLILPRRQGNTYYAAMDPATSGNGWTLTIGTREGGRTIVVFAYEWRGTPDNPLDPGKILEEIATICQGYGISLVHSDRVMGQALVTLARQQGLTLLQWTIPRVEQAKKFLSIRTHMDMGLIELPPNPKLRTDLLHVRRRPTPGGVAIDLPMTSDGRHCDYAPSLMLVLSKLLPDPVEPKLAAEDNETTRMRQQMLDRFRPKEDW